MEERGRTCSSMSLQAEVIQISRIDVRPGLEAKAVEVVFAVVFLPVQSPGTATMLPFIGVKDLDGFLPARKSWVFFFEERECGQGR